MFPCFLTLDHFRVWEINWAQSIREPLDDQYLDLLGCEILTLVAGKFFGFKKEREEKKSPSSPQTSSALNSHCGPRTGLSQRAHGLPNEEPASLPRDPGKSPEDTRIIYGRADFRSSHPGLAMLGKLADPISCPHQACTVFRV